MAVSVSVKDEVSTDVLPDGDFQRSSIWEWCTSSPMDAAHCTRRRRCRRYRKIAAQAMKNTAIRQTTVTATAKLLPRVDACVGKIVGETAESAHLGVGPGRRSLVPSTNRIGWPSNVPGPASGVPEKDVRRRKGGMDKTEDSYHRWYKT